MWVLTPVRMRMPRTSCPAFGGAPCHSDMALSKLPPVGLQAREIWCAPAHPARELDRRSFIALSGAAAAASAMPLWARGPASYPPPTQELMAPVPGGRVYVRVN